MLFQFDLYFIFRIVLGALTNTNPKSLEVGELFTMEALQSGNSDFVIAVLDFWKDQHKVVSCDDSTKVMNVSYGKIFIFMCLFYLIKCADESGQER